MPGETEKQNKYPGKVEQFICGMYIWDQTELRTSQLFGKFLNHYALFHHSLGIKMAKKRFYHSLGSCINIFDKKTVAIGS